jgi:prepilin-type N-terminal cleavage/methylation domain-containing protein
VSNVLNNLKARRDQEDGFTLIELMVVVVLIGVGAALVMWGFGAQKEREKLRGASLELRGVLTQARQSALASGNRVAVMFFPNVVTSLNGATGRYVIYEDGEPAGAGLFDAGGTVNFDAFDPRSPRQGPNSRVIDTMDLPFLVSMGPADGWGAGARATGAYAGIPLDNPCAFCTGIAGRGAIVFEPLGTVTFHDRNGPALALTGAAVSLTARDTREVKTIVVAANGSLLNIFTTR